MSLSLQYRKLLLIFSLPLFCVMLFSRSVFAQGEILLELVPMLAGAELLKTVVWQGQEWQYCDNGETYTWEEANAYCEKLIQADHDDWRLPTYAELKKLVVCTNGVDVPLQDYPGHPYFCGDGTEQNYSIPTIDGLFKAHPWYYWSQTEANAYEAWALHFGVGGARESIARKAGTWVRCVRDISPGSEPPPPDVPDPQIVTWQGRDWQLRDNGEKYTWEEAKSYCENLILADHDDWTLPDWDELRSLVVCSNGVDVPLSDYPDHPYYCGDGNDLEYAVPTIDGSFESHAWYYWSRTESSPYTAWALHFGVGGAKTSIDRNAGVWVRCVRETPANP